ncbi:MAG: hypothetical protein RIR51_1158, partial [Bacteroidota bacterium]
MIRISFLLLLFFCLFSGKVYSQSMVGNQGLLKAPNARLMEDRHFSIGTSYVPPGFYLKTWPPYQGLATGKAGINYFVNLNILPFLDVMFRYSAEYG